MKGEYRVMRRPKDRPDGRWLRVYWDWHPQPIISPQRAEGMAASARETFPDCDIRVEGPEA